MPAAQLSTRPLLILLVLSVASPPAAAVQVYNCVGTDGTATFSDRPCDMGGDAVVLEIAAPPTGWDPSAQAAATHDANQQFAPGLAARREAREAAAAAQRAAAAPPVSAAPAEPVYVQPWAWQWSDWGNRPDCRPRCGGWSPPPITGPNPTPRDDRFPPSPRAPMNLRP